MSGRLRLRSLRVRLEPRWRLYNPRHWAKIDVAVRFGYYWRMTGQRRIDLLREDRCMYRANSRLRWKIAHRPNLAKERAELVF